MDKITASIASMPTRIYSLKETVISIINQVDQILVYLNNYETIPYYLENPKIKVVLSKFAFRDLGDAGKFFGASGVNGYHFTMDDDIIYPHDYVKKTIEAIEKYNRKSIVSYHGRIFDKKPVKSYYKDAKRQLSFLKTVYHDEIIDVPGTGVMAYHTDTIKFNLMDFETTNMADIWAAKKAKQNKIPITILSHTRNWLKESKLSDINQSIYKSVSHNDSFQTEILNSFIAR